MIEVVAVDKEIVAEEHSCKGMVAVLTSIEVVVDRHKKLVADYNFVESRVVVEDCSNKAAVDLVVHVGMFENRNKVVVEEVEKNCLKAYLFSGFECSVASYLYLLSQF